MIEKIYTLYLLIIIIVIMIMTDPSHALAVPMRRGESESIPPFESLKNITTNASNTLSPSNFPVGLLTMKNPTNGQLVSCTASVINTQNGNVVATAAHCLVNTEGKVFRNIMFSPGFNHGKDGPIRKIGPAKVVKVPDTFLANNEVDDYGLLRFDFRTQDGRNLQQVTGALGWKFNMGTDIPTTVFGYPANGNFDNCPNDAATLCSWSGTTKLVNNLYTAPGKIFGSGSSGGPWILNYDPSTNLGHLYANTEGANGQDAISPVYNEDTFNSLLNYVLTN